MIRGYIALRRQLRDFVDSCNVPWSDVTERYDRDEAGRILRDDDRAEIAFRHKGRLIELAIFAPSKDKDHRPDGKNILPLGKIAARIDGGIVTGVIDSATWNSIKRAIYE